MKNSLIINKKPVFKMPSFAPSNEMILITGRIDVMGVPLFCGSVIVSSEDGIEFKSCATIEPDLFLYNELKDVKEGDMIKVNRIRNKDFKKAKFSYNIETVDTDDLEVIQTITDKVEEFKEKKEFYSTTDFTF